MVPVFSYSGKNKRWNSRIFDLEHPEGCDVSVPHCLKSRQSCILILFTAWIKKYKFCIQIKWLYPHCKPKIVIFKPTSFSTCKLISLINSKLLIEMKQTYVSLSWQIYTVFGAVTFAFMHSTCALPQIN